MRILVTGVSGQVGSVLAKSLAAAGSVVPADRNVLDLGDISSISRRLDDLAPDVIVNPAAYTAVDRAEDEAALAFRINGEAPGVVAQWAARRSVPLLHFSTDYVFDGSGQRPWRVDDITNPLSVYGQSKLAGERAVRAAGGPHLILRTSWIYHHTGLNFLRTIARLAAERTELRIVADQIGAPTSAASVADTLAALIQTFDGNIPALVAAADRTLHLACSGAASWHDFAVAVVTGLRARGYALMVERVIPIKTSEHPTKARRPQNSRLDLSRLEALLGGSMPPWQAALDTELDRLVARHNRPGSP